MQKRQTAHQVQEFQEVIHDLNQAIEKSPNFARAHLQLAYELQEKRSRPGLGPLHQVNPGKDKLNEALEHLKKAKQVMQANGYIAHAEPC